jgi:hypothetical protein
MDVKTKALFQTGVLAFRTGKYSDALERFNEVCSPHPSVLLADQVQVIAGGAITPVVFESRSATFERLGQISEALRDARKVIGLVPSSPQVVDSFCIQK